MKLSIRAPRENEWPICRMLLPETFGDAATRHFLLATLDQRIAAAASFRIDTGSITHLRLHVIPPLRRRGIGSEVLAHVASLTSGPLSGTVELMRETEATAFCLRNGLERAESLITVEAEIATFRDSMNRLSERIQRSRNVACVPLRDAPAEEVARLHAEQVASNHAGSTGPAELNPWRALVAGTPGLSGSQVAMVDGRVAGILLWDMEDGIAVIRSRAVVPGRHGSAINAVLLAQALEAGWACGARRTRFCFLDSNRDTVKLAQRLRAETVSAVARFVGRGSEPAGA